MCTLWLVRSKHHGLHGCQFLPLVNQYTVFMQLHDKTIVWLQLCILNTSHWKSCSKIISCWDSSKSSFVDRLWMSELNSEREQWCIAKWVANHAEIGKYQHCSGFHFGEPYSSNTGEKTIWPCIKSTDRNFIFWQTLSQCWNYISMV